MSHRFNRIFSHAFRLGLAALSVSTVVGCASDASDQQVEISRTTAAVSTCGGALGGSYSTLSSYYVYPAQSLNVACAAAGASLSVFVSADDVPNKFTLLDGSGNVVTSSAWLGSAAYSGPWGASLSNSGTGSLSFSNNSGPYAIKVETLTPPNGSYPHTTDVWSASASCSCAPPPAAHYSCGYAMAFNNCDNGRTHLDITAADMTAAIAACKATRPAGYPDFCYVLDRDAPTSSDVAECTAAPASWRAGNSCCNFYGTKSCPM